MAERDIVLLIGNCQSGHIAQFLRGTPGFSEHYETAIFSNYQAIFTGGTAAADRERALLHAFVSSNRSRIKTFIRQKTHGWFDDELTPKHFANGTELIEYPAMLLNYIWPLIPHGAHRFQANEIQGKHFPFSVMDAEVVRLKKEGVPEDELIDRYLEIDIVHKYRIDRLRRLNEIKATEIDAMSSFPMWPFISEQMSHIQMFRTENHPNGPALGELLYQIGQRTSAIPDRKAWDARIEAARNGLGIMAIEAPIHPQVAEHFDLRWAKDKKFNFWNYMSLSFEEYLLKIYRYDCDEEYWRARRALVARDFDEADKQINLALERHPELPAFYAMKERIKSVWSKSEFGAKSSAAVSTFAMRQVEPLVEIPGFTHIVEVCAGRFATTEALRLAYGDRFTVEGSDIPGVRLDEATKAHPDLQIFAEDAVAVAARLRPHKTIFVAINVLGNLVLEDLDEFLRLVSQAGSALIFVARGLAADEPDDSRPRPKIGHDHNFPLILARHNMESLSLRTQASKGAAIAYYGAYIGRVADAESQRPTSTRREHAGGSTFTSAR